MPSLKPLNSYLPADIAALPGELLRDVVRAAVSKGECIEVTTIDEEVGALLKPFADFPLLLEIAESEVMRVNTFIVSFNEWGRDIMVEDPGGFRKTAIAITKKSIISQDHGPVSEKSRPIRHLEVGFTIRLEGKHFENHDIADWELCPKSESCLLFLGWIMELMPALETMNFEVDNQGAPDRGQDRYYVNAQGILLEDPRDPLFVAAEKTEKLLDMEQILIMAASTRPTESLKSKTVTFIQNPSSSEAGLTLDGKAYETVELMAQEDFETHSCLTSDLNRVRAAVVFCELKGEPRRVLEETYGNSLGWEECGSQEDRFAMFQSNVGKADLQLLEQILRSEKAVVNLP